MTYYHRDQPGGVFGGPIRKNKTFFFGTYEYTHSKSPSSQTATFPTHDQRNGNFSKTLLQQRPDDHDVQPLRHL